MGFFHQIFYTSSWDMSHELFGDIWGFCAFEMASIYTMSTDKCQSDIQYQLTNYGHL